MLNEIRGEFLFILEQYKRMPLLALPLMAFGEELLIVEGKPD
jgi:hypothetical protein